LKKNKWNRWRFYIIWLSFKWMFRVNLGDVVWYSGKKYTVCNGVRCNSWRLGDLDNGDDGWVKRDLCRKLWTVKNMCTSFKSGYSFYMSNWYGIWRNGGIKPWMRTINIW
jgi:hypothetical protein